MQPGGPCGPPRLQNGKAGAEGKAFGSRFSGRYAPPPPPKDRWDFCHAFDEAPILPPQNPSAKLARRSQRAAGQHISLENRGSFPSGFPPLFQKRAGVWGRSPQQGPGAEPRSLAVYFISRCCPAFPCPAGIPWPVRRRREAPGSGSPAPAAAPSGRWPFPPDTVCIAPPPPLRLAVP